MSKQTDEPTSNPAFHRVVEHFLKTPPKPNEAMKKSGDSFQDLASDYGCTPEAIHCELPIAA